MNNIFTSIVIPFGNLTGFSIESIGIGIVLVIILYFTLYQNKEKDNEQ